MTDQAARLRQIAERYRNEIRTARSASPRRARVLAVTSGKGGVGKTNLTVNLSYALVDLEREVMVLDADLGLANVDVLLGTVPNLHLGHVIEGKADILDVIYEAEGGLKLIAGGSGVEELADLPESDLLRFIRSLRKLESRTDFLLIDTGAGMGRHVTDFVLAADMVLVVCTVEPTSITDAYALIKTVVRRNPAADIKLVMNQAENRADAEEAADRLSATVLRFLDTSVELLGVVPMDREVSRSVRNQQPFYLAAPSSPASRAVRELAQKIAGESAAASTGVGLFFDRVARVFTRR